MGKGVEHTQPSSLPRSLPLELFQQILSYVAPNRETTVHIDKAMTRRQFLSTESLKPPRPSRDSAGRHARRDIGRFRLASKALADIGAPYLFTQVATRFTRKSLSHLDRLASWPHLARHVTRFSYLMPYFLEHGLGEIEQELRRVGLRDFEKLCRKIAEQKSIMDEEYDVKVLCRAISRFTSLQLVQLLRRQDDDYGTLLQHLRSRTQPQQSILDWDSALLHASHTLGTALLASSDVHLNRVSLPMASPLSASLEPKAVSFLAERLTCLTLHFEGSEDLDTKVRDLATLFRMVFRGAKRMKAVHVGFPSDRPLTLTLEEVFHHVTWPDLVAFGIQGWELDADEIIRLIGRHCEKLRGIRLRDVHLKAGSRWRDVLAYLRQLTHLNWVSLRRISYTAYHHSEEYAQAAGSEVPDFDSESEDEDAQHREEDIESDFESDDSDTSDDEEQPTSDVESNYEHGPEAHEMEFPENTLHSPILTSSFPRCHCDAIDNVSVEDLDDNEYRVDNEKRKFWEAWVLRRCAWHANR